MLPCFFSKQCEHFAIKGSVAATSEIGVQRPTQGVSYGSAIVGYTVSRATNTRRKTSSGVIRVCWFEFRALFSSVVQDCNSVYWCRRKKADQSRLPSQGARTPGCRARLLRSIVLKHASAISSRTRCCWTVGVLLATCYLQKSPLQ